MRFKLTLKLVDPLRNILPVNYQFELGSWFYKLLNNKDFELYSYLATTGYIKKDEPFRNFVFSHLMVQDRKIEGDRLTIQSERIALIFSTIPDDFLIPLVKAVFQDACFLLGDKISQVSLLVEKVERLADPDFTDKMSFRTLSPLHLTVKIHGRINELFLSPEHPNYAQFFYENLQRKYKILYGYDYPLQSLPGKFKLRSTVTQKGITIHSGTAGQNKLIGYQLRFRLQADPALIRSGYYLGFGEKNHLGFGCCENL
ncbi:MAG TPA: CRISPR-associated endoribonuclease Cas6 [Prolixibacteraceae bacterium]